MAILTSVLFREHNPIKVGVMIPHSSFD